MTGLVDEPLLGGEYGAGGVVAGFPAFGCPICNAVLLALFSSSALVIHLDHLRSSLGVASVGLFVALLYSQHRRPADGSRTRTAGGGR